MEMIDKQMFIN